MANDKDIELTARAGEVDEIAVQEALEDERIKTEQQHSGGALEVCFPTQWQSPAVVVVSTSAHFF